MRPWRFICVSLGMIGFFGGPGARAVSAQANAQAVQQEIDQLRRDFDALKQQYGDRLIALEARLAAIQGGQSGAAAPPPAAAAAPPLTAQVPAGAEGAGGPSGQLPIYGTTGAAVSGAKVFNPDMAVIGDFLGAT